MTNGQATEVKIVDKSRTDSGDVAWCVRLTTLRTFIQVSSNQVIDDGIAKKLQRFLRTCHRLHMVSLMGECLD